MEPGYMALSIYCAHMSSKWSRVLDSRPIQGNDMSAEVYYDQFCNWKKKLEEVNYMGDEGSYIDDFLYGLRMDLAIRVWGYKWKPCTLYGAFRRAEMEETMLLWKELPRENDVDKVFEDMSQPNFLNITEALEAEGVPYEKRNGVWKLLDSEEGTENEITYKQEDSGPGDLENEEDDFLHLMADNSLVEMVGQSFSSNLEVGEDAHYMLDKMLQPVPVSLTLDLVYDATEIGSIYGSYKSRLDGVTMETKALFGKKVGENESRYKFEDISHPNSVGVVKARGDMSILNILCSFKLGDITALNDIDDKDTCSEAMGVKDVCDSPFNDTVKGLYGLWASNAVNRLCLFRLHAIELETYECKYDISFYVIEELFYFDPGGRSLSQMDSDLSEFNVEQSDYCLVTNMADVNVKAIIMIIRTMIAYVLESVVRYRGIDGVFLEHMERTLVEWSLLYFFSRRNCPPSKNVCICVVDWCFHGASGLVSWFMTKWIHMALEYGDIDLAWKTLCKYAIMETICIGYNAIFYDILIKYLGRLGGLEFFINCFKEGAGKDASHDRQNSNTLVDVFGKSGNTEVTFKGLEVLNTDEWWQSLTSTFTIGAKFDNFIWDPGLRPIFVYIIEDNDFLKRNGIGIRIALKQIWKMSYYTVDFFVDYSVGKPFTPSSRIVPILELVVRTQNGIIVMALFEEKFSIDFYSTYKDVEGPIPYSMHLWGDNPSSSLFLVILCLSSSTYHFQFGQCCIIVGDAIRILEYFGEYMHGRYSVRSKLVCCITYSSSNCSCMSEFVKLLCTREMPIGDIRHGAKVDGFNLALMMELASPLTELWGWMDSDLGNFRDLIPSTKKRIQCWLKVSSKSWKHGIYIY